MKSNLILLAWLLATLHLPLATAHAGPGQALYFNGTLDQYVTVQDNDQLTFTNGFTWEAWVNVTKTNWPFQEEWATIIAKDCFANEAWFSVFTNGNFDVRFAAQAFTQPQQNATAARAGGFNWD